jgi:hypothetical protein
LEHAKRTALTNGNGAEKYIKNSRELRPYPWAKKKAKKGGFWSRGTKKKKKRGRCHGTFFEIPFEIFSFQFSGLVLENVFVVFLGSSCRETAKNAIKANRRGKTTRFFFPSQLSTFPPKSFLWCF